MDEQEIMSKVINILKPYARDKDALDGATKETSILQDLKVNSSRLVDIVLAFEDEFDIEIGDGEADQVRTVGAAVDLISQKV